MTKDEFFKIDSLYKDIDTLEKLKKEIHETSFDKIESIIDGHSFRIPSCMPYRGVRQKLKDVLLEEVEKELLYKKKIFEELKIYGTFE